MVALRPVSPMRTGACLYSATSAAFFAYASMNLTLASPNTAGSVDCVT